MYSQEEPFVCPGCYEFLNKNNILEIVEYPPELYRGKLKSGKAYKFECPKCFCISYLHINKGANQ